jgi:hypothetical protein
MSNYKIIRTNDGYMVEDLITYEYLDDGEGNNCFDALADAIGLMEWRIEDDHLRDAIYNRIEGIK